MPSSCPTSDLAIANENGTRLGFQRWTKLFNPLPPGNRGLVNQLTLVRQIFLPIRRRLIHTGFHLDHVPSRWGERSQAVVVFP